MQFVMLGRVERVAARTCNHRKADHAILQSLKGAKRTP